METELAKFESLDSSVSNSLRLECLRKLMTFEKNIDKMLSKKRLEI